MSSVKRNTAAPALQPVQRHERAAPPPVVVETKSKGWVASGPARTTATAAGDKPTAKAAAAPLEASPLLQRFNLGDRADRIGLAEASPQVNTLSKAARNSNDICAGAATVNALILGSDTPEAAKANAKALTNLADRFDTWNHLPPSVPPAMVRTAIGNLGRGTMTSRDAQALQQLVYAAGRSLLPAKQSPGLTAPALAGVLTQLRHEGAQLPADTRLVEVAKKNGDAHWVAVADQVYVNSNQDPKAGEAMASVVVPDELSVKHGIFESDVRVGSGPQDVAVRMRTGKEGTKRLGEGQAYQFGFDPTTTFIDGLGLKQRPAFEADLSRITIAGINRGATSVE